MQHVDTAIDWFLSHFFETLLSFGNLINQLYDLF